MTKSDIIAAAGSDKSFVGWLGFELDHEDVTRKDGTIITENVTGDSGGLTFAGIDKASHPDFPYDNPKPSDVVAAYRHDWDGVCGPQIPGPVAAVVANFAVNMGHSPAVKLLQTALGIKVDGDLGPGTVAAAQLYPEPFVLAHEIISLADVRYHSLVDNNVRLAKFLLGWICRDNDLRQEIDREHREETQA